jgi:hypothetical protein
MSRLTKYLLLTLIVATNCVTPYDFDAEEGGTYFVVSGGVNQLDETNSIKLSYSTKYGTNSRAQPIDDAQIVLVNSRNEKERFYYQDDGVYVHYGLQVPVLVGESYHIEIETSGKNYRTDPQRVPEPIVPDRLTYDVGYATEVNTIGNEVTRENIDIFIDTPININGEISYLRWKTDESWVFTEIQCHPLHMPKSCFMYRKLETERIFIYDSEGISGKYLERKLIAQKTIDDRVEFIERHFFNGHQYTLTRKAYEYWGKVVDLANPSGDIFDLPPAPLPGNLYNIDDPDEIVLGYFEVSSKAIARADLTQADFRPFTVNSKPYLCSYAPRTDYVEACCQCLVLPSSSTERPDYW